MAGVARNRSGQWVDERVFGLFDAYPEPSRGDGAACFVCSAETNRRRGPENAGAGFVNPPQPLSGIGGGGCRLCRVARVDRVGADGQPARLRRRRYRRRDRQHAVFQRHGRRVQIQVAGQADGAGEAAGMALPEQELIVGAAGFRLAGTP